MTDAAESLHPAFSSFDRVVIPGSGKSENRERHRSFNRFRHMMYNDSQNAMEIIPYES